MSFNLSSPFSSMKSSSLGKSCKKAAKSLSQLFHKNKQDGVFSRVVKKISPNSVELNKKTKNQQNETHPIAEHDQSIEEIKDTLPSTPQITVSIENTSEPKDDLREWLTILVNSPLFDSTENDTTKHSSIFYPSPISTSPSPWKQPEEKCPNDSNQPIVNILQPPSHYQKKPQMTISSHYTLKEQFDSSHQHSTTMCQGDTKNKSLLSAQLQQRDEVKERLDVAAAKRKAIKKNRLKEQMDLAWFETMEMIRSHENSNKVFPTPSNDLFYQKLQMHSQPEPSSSKDAFNQPDILIW
ncbi:hypothetical protein CU097_007608 [Rhizopus azygosporus]|uniref:Uncharacterized protein n=2 Tax=Rhizopus TaxID=4842 RepID=A0A367JFJ5_RHIAZ|nr:hypothetical protein G6F68_005860 [Rhizopus microsporus]ORE13861.1 hypothetical protein BCV71DRAFT_60158 [Rhizopus microsporus]RCH88723.1 hypothetical protein CU097_007608 [Rhizopus azygosporus]CEJ02914.1 hypothetical protein RMCBS344292_16906 [Rhizopus microsporus]